MFIVSSFILTYLGRIVKINLVNNSHSLALLMSSMVSLEGYLSQITYFVGALANDINTVERLKRWVVANDYEGVLNLGVTTEQWPQTGRLDFNDIKVRYREGLPLVIDGLDLGIKPGEKVGIVGRTGSGKSTLLLTLVRILEVSEGSIEIDGVDISTIGLHELRRKLVIIPQDPYLFEGTLRENLDPFAEYSNAEIVNVLKMVNLTENLNIESTQMTQDLGGGSMKPATSSLNGNQINTLLNMKISSKGGNLSLGQRQLICIGRALIQKPKILLIDEATASIDQKTDALIQKILKDNLAGVTVLAIAHRLETIIEYDRVVVLGKGKMIEQGAPIDLMEKREEFYSMVAEGGEDFAERMTSLSRRAKLERRNSVN